MLFHVASRSDCLDGHPLLPFELVAEIISFVNELVVLLHRCGHFLDSFVFLNLAFLSENGLCSEHAGEKLSVLANLLQLIVDLLLELSSVLEFREVKVFVLVVLVFSVSQLGLNLEVFCI